MSEVVSKKGVLKPTGNTAKEYMRDHYSMNTEEVPIYYKDHNEWLADDLYMKVVIINDLVFEICDESNINYNEIFESELLEDGSYKFTIKYHNGGMDFKEAIEKALIND